MAENPTDPGAPGAESAAPSWQGYYINLDRAEDRRRRMEAEFARLGIGDRYRRFPAVEGSALGRDSPIQAGEVGAFRSHFDAIAAVAESGRHAHILEDDEILSGLTVPAVTSIVERGIADEFDIVFGSTFLGRSLASLRTFHQLYERLMKNGPIRRPEELQILDITESYEFGMRSYIVGPRGARRIAEMFGAEWEKGPALPVDLALRDAARAGRVRVGCLFPFVTVAHLESVRETSTKLVSDRTRAMIQPLARYAVFVDRDLAFATPILDATLENLGLGKPDDAVDLCVQALARHLDLPERSSGR